MNITRLLHGLAGFRRSQSRAASGRRSRLFLPQIDPRHVLYAIGDVHGCLKALQAAELCIFADLARQNRAGTIVLLGDYVDRGPHSAQVIEHLRQPTPPLMQRIALCGNHDDLFLRFLRRPEKHRHWLEMGGDKTLCSYGIDATKLLHSGGLPALSEAMLRLIPSDHVDFLAGLPVFLAYGQHLFVHAGIRPSIPLEDQTEEDLLWIREPFLSTGPGLPVTVVHGHTVVKEPIFAEGRIGIDTGCYRSGRLTVLKLQENTVDFLPVPPSGE
ncbi:metallophosphoesterase [Rhizobium rhizosphaerae]|uniref:metallophosphoesterase n=1 Tax=Xaviernesmea rhizosphaerae TaxID=1672749 RepID=UPI0009BF4A54|nr:metallophosphoesterase [Xaviernesmea rhizosphaerae]